MKELFTAFLSVSISGSIIICLVLLFRLIFQKAPKALFCVLWGLVILRLMLPFQIGSPISLRPETPVFTKTDTQLFGHQETYEADELPTFVPVQKKNMMVTVDYFAIAGTVWCSVAVGMLLYTLITYLRLKHRVSQAIKLDKNVFESHNLNTAFLLGYVRPKIYLPAQMDEENARLVISHEQAHIRRGDNWFKLIAFICLALHWFNPLVWIAYMLICRDIEDACDEAVVRGLDEQGRKDYSSALLSCGKGKKTLAACPVAFGEISIRQRILKVLNYRKPALWISVAAIVIILAVSLFFMTDPSSQEPPYFDELCASMGQPLEVTCEKLGISSEDLVSVDPVFSRVFDLPMQVEYMGAEFSVLLTLSPVEDTLHSFAYVAEIQSDREKAAAAAVGVGKEMLRQFGKPFYESDGKERVAVTEATEDKLVAIYENKRGEGAMSATWDISDGAAPEVIDYLCRYKESEYWIDGFGSRFQIVPYPNFYVQLSTSRNSETDIIRITMDYQVGIGTTSRFAPYEEQTWWDKVQNWLK